MSASSRTPEGQPHHCPVCGRFVVVEVSSPFGDSVSPSCGQLLWLFSDRLAALTGADPGEIRLDTPVRDLGVDSFDLLDLAAEAEERFGVVLSDEEVGRIDTVEDGLRLVERLWRRSRGEGPP